MDPGIYKFIHYLGIFFLLTGLGGLIFAEKDQIKVATISHGIGLLLILLGGFGMQATIEGLGFPFWFTVKLVIWLVLGGLVVALKQKLMPPVAAWVIVIVLCGVASWLGLANSVILR